MVHEATIERWADFRAKYPVFIGLATRVETRMKVERDLANVVDANNRREKTIYGSSKIIGRDGIRDGNGRNLGDRMNARVGSARSSYVYWPALDGADYLFENALYGWKSGLHLPTVEIGAVVGNLETQSPHERVKQPSD
jgi:hypothetical protein